LPRDQYIFISTSSIFFKFKHCLLYIFFGSLITFDFLFVIELFSDIQSHVKCYCFFSKKNVLFIDRSTRNV